MIYSFYFEGGNMDGEVVRTDFAAPMGRLPGRPLGLISRSGEPSG